jgi:hypothetical protein
VEAGVICVGAKLLLFSRGKADADFECQLRFFAWAVLIEEPDGETFPELVLGWLKDTCSDIIEAIVGGAEAEDAAEFVELDYEPTPVAPGTDKPIKAQSVFAGKGKSQVEAIGEIAGPGIGKQGNDLGYQI